MSFERSSHAGGSLAGTPSLALLQLGKQRINGVVRRAHREWLLPLPRVGQHNPPRSEHLTGHRRSLLRQAMLRQNQDQVRVPGEGSRLAEFGLERV